MADQATAPQPGREPRSRHDRPCDICRRHKHLCMIPVRGQPCVSCATRKKACTFDMPPTARKRKAKGDSAGTGTGSANGGETPDGSEPGSSRSAVAKSRNRTTAYSHSHSHSQPHAPPPPHGERNPLAAALPADAGPSWEFPDGDGAMFRLASSHSSSAVRLDGEGAGAGAPAALFPAAASANPYAIDDDVDANPPSLDGGDGEEEEAHFVGTRAFFGLMLKEGEEGTRLERPNATFERVATLAFRQVSSDPRLPAYFIKHPSLIYGRPLSAAKSACETVWDLCRTVGDNIPARSMDLVKTVTLPAWPIVNTKRLDLACTSGTDGVPVPYALLAGIVAHTTSYIPELRPLHRDMWSQIIRALEDEYLQPRLRVIQLALLILSSRPSENTGQSEIGLSRAVGAAHLLGLHIDPTHWNLPRWERSVRKRMWWGLLIHDKWRALLYGRPSNIHGSDHNVTPPTIHDADAGTAMSPSDTLSFESFIATCQLTVVVDKVLRQFYTVQALVRPATGLTRIAALEAIRAELDEFEESLPQGLRLWQEGHTGTLPTGVRSFQVSLCGIKVISNRLVVEAMSDRPGPHTSMALTNALVACERLTQLVVQLTEADRALFWMPYTSHHISNAVSLLLRIALSDRKGDMHLLDSAISCTRRLIDWLVATEPAWDLSSATLRRITTPLLIASRELPQLHEAYVLNFPLHNGQSMATTADRLIESLGIGLGPADVLGDLAWLNSEFWPALGDIAF